MSDTFFTHLNNALQEAPPDRHSYFQLKHFVLGKEPTIQGKIWQCLKELRSRKSQMEAIEREIAESKDRLELLDIQKEESAFRLTEFLFGECAEQPRKLALRKNEVLDRQLNRQVESIKETLGQLEDKLKYTREECHFFLQSLAEFKAASPIKPFDDLAAQKDYWSERLANEVHLKLILRQPLDVELVKTVLSLHDDSPIKLQVCSILAASQKSLDGGNGYPQPKIS